MLASKLWAARNEGRQVDAAEFDVPADTDAAYAVQAEMIRDAGIEVAGWKLGATAQATLDLLNLEEPMAGPIFANVVFDASTEVPVAAAHGPALETEFTAIIGADLPPRQAPYTRDEITVASVHPSFEIIAARDTTGQQVTVHFNGEEVGGGSFEILLWDDILEALVWTANHPKVAPRGLRAGDAVMTGTVAGLIPFAPGVTATADFGPFGTIETRFVAA